MTDRVNLHAVLDFANAVRLGEDLTQSVHDLAPLARVVHLRDLVILPESIGTDAPWPAAPLGCGSLDIGKALQELYNGGFSGVYYWNYLICTRTGQEKRTRSFAKASLGWKTGRRLEGSDSSQRASCKPLGMF